MTKFLSVFIASLALFSASLVPAHAAGSGFKGQSLVQEYLYDYSVDGGSTSAFIDLSAKKWAQPLAVGCVVDAVNYHVISALTSSGAATIAVGDASNNARYVTATGYLGGAFDTDDVRAASGVPIVVDAANTGKFGVKFAGAAVTAGKIMFYVKYYCPKNQ